MEVSRNRILLLISIVVGLFAFLFIFYELILLTIGPTGIETLNSWWSIFRQALINNGFLLYLSIASLPALVLPVAPLLTLAGLWGEEHGPWVACLYCVLALSINLSWTYWVARGPARSVLIKLLNKSRFRLPESPPKNLLQWALILRLTPGVPFIFSNYGLGILKMPFSQYMLISIPIIGCTACGYVLAFTGIFGGNWSYVWGGLSLIIIMVVIGRLTLSKSKNAD